MYPQFMIGPTQIVLNITNRCNQSCRYCFNSSAAEVIANELTDTEVEQIVDYFVDCLKPHNVCFTGGEPLLRKSLVCKCVQKLSRAGIRTNLLTNGILLNAEVFDKLRSSGIREVQVSLDGPDEESHEAMRGKGTFKGALGALEVMRDSGFLNFLACMTISRHNWNRVTDMIELMGQLDAPVLHLRPWLPVGRAARYSQATRLTAAQLRSVRRVVLQNEQDPNTVDILFPDPLSHLYALKEGQPMFGMEISSTGDYILSPYLKASFGNIREQTIGSIWESGWWAQGQHPSTLRTLEQTLYGAGGDILAVATGG